MDQVIVVDGMRVVDLCTTCVIPGHVPVVVGGVGGTLGIFVVPRVSSYGVADAARTRDLLNHNQVLYQLSYSHHVQVISIM